MTTTTDHRYQMRCSTYWKPRLHDDTSSSWIYAEELELPRPKNFDVPFSSVLRHAKQLSLFVDMDPEILGGTPRIADTRIPVYMVLKAIDEYCDIKPATKAYRALTEQEIRDALRFATHVLESPLEYESPDSR